MNTTLGYAHFLAANQLSEEAVQRMMRDLPAPVWNSEVDSAFHLAPSQINGLGMFASRRVARGEEFPVCCGLVRYKPARYVNHSDTPNAVLNFVAIGMGVMTILANVEQGDEVTMDYNDNWAKSMKASALYALNELAPPIS